MLFQPRIKNYKTLVLIFIFVILNLFCHFDSVICYSMAYAQNNKAEPLIVNGDVVEFSSDSKEVTATGNVKVVYKGTTLTCKKLNVNTQTKVGFAEGDVRLDEEKGVIEGEKIKYNFQTKVGTVLKPQFRFSPYFGTARELDKISDAEFIAKYGYITTCSMNRPHWRLKAKKTDVFPNDKVQIKNATAYFGRIPVATIPQYNHSLKDPIMHVQMMPGKRKDWGAYLLSAWRYDLSENIKGRIFLDYRSKWG